MEDPISWARKQMCNMIKYTSPQYAYIGQILGSREKNVRNAVYSGVSVAVGFTKFQKWRTNDEMFFSSNYRMRPALICCLCYSFVEVVLIFIFRTDFGACVGNIVSIKRCSSDHCRTCFLFDKYHGAVATLVELE